MGTGVAVDVVFLGFDKWLRTAPAWLTMLMVFGIVLLVAGGIYLYTRLQEMRRLRSVSPQDEETSRDKMANIQKAMAGKRDKIMEEREERLKEIPAGPIEPNELPPATVKIRNRVENVPSNAEFGMGKAPDNELVIPELGISRKHAKIRPEKTGYVLYDLVSSRGTAVNGAKITQRTLRDDDQIKIGPETIVFNIKK